MTLASARLSVRLTLLALGMLSLGTLPAQAITGRADVASSAYDAFGASPQFAPVGSLFIVGRNSNGEQTFGMGGSGTLISSQWVLTAAHVVARPGTAVVDPFTTFTVGGTNYNFSEIVVHPGWTGQLEDGNDIALIKLATPITNITPATLFTGRNELDFASSAVNAGYGLKGDGVTGESELNSTLRAAENDLDLYGFFGSDNQIFGSTVDGDLLLQDFDSPTSNTSSMGSSTPRALEGSIANGDSGGALMVNVGGQWQLAGVHSFISDMPVPLASYGTIGGSTRVSNFIDFINGTIAADATAPEPTAGALLGVGGLALGVIRRNSRRRRNLS